MTPTEIELSKLSSSPARDFADPAKVERCGDFDWRKYQPIEVEQDGPRLIIMNGMTRVELARRAGITPLPAYVCPTR